MLLVFFGLLEVQRVVHRNRHLSRHLLHEVELFFRHGRRSEAEHQRSQAVLRGGERQPAGSDDVVAAQQFHHRRPARFGPHIGNHQRFLMQEYPSGRGLLWSEIQIRRRLGSGSGRGFEDVQSHSVGARVMQHQVQEIEAQNGAQKGGKIAKKPRQIAMLQDSLRDIQEGLISNGFQLKTSIGRAT